MKTNRLLVLGLSLLTLGFSACKKDDKKTDETPVTSKYANGAFILNEGSTSGASVSFLDFSTDAISNDIFMDVNKRPVGKYLQSACVNGDNLYLVANGSDKIEIVRKSDFVSVGVIENLAQPRNMIVVNGKGYITQWGSDGLTGGVSVVNLSTNQIIKTILAGKGCEGLVNVNGKIWVANGGGFDCDSTISIIDPTTDVVSKTIRVSHNPLALKIDKNGNVWALCAGIVKYNIDYSAIIKETPSRLYKLSATSEDTVCSYQISTSFHPMRLDINKTKEILFYGIDSKYTDGNIYSLNINDPAISNSPFISGYFYGFNVNLATGDFYTLEAPDFTSAGILRKYTSAGTFAKQYTVGVGPNSIIFQ